MRLTQLAALALTTLVVFACALGFRPAYPATADGGSAGGLELWLEHDADRPRSLVVGLRNTAPVRQVFFVSRWLLRSTNGALMFAIVSSGGSAIRQPGCLCPP